MASTYSREELDYMFHHVFLPPQLPHAAEESDERPRLEASLLKAATESIRRYRQRCPLKDRAAVRCAMQGLEAVAKIHNTSTRDVNEDALTDWLAATAKDRLDVPLPLHIRSQNAGVIIHWKDGFVFDAFELSATNQKVIGTIGRLRRCFPTSSVLVDHKHATQKEFQATVAHTLAAMATESAASMQPQIQKAGRDVEEIRDTTDPAIVTKLFFGAFLQSIGSSQKVCGLLKNTRDEVLWHDTLLPWRRSPLWLLIRVHLQLTFQRSGKPEHYKRFMVAFMADVLDSAVRSSLPSPMLHAMSAKISRRLIKLGTPLPPQLLDPLREILTATSQTLQDRWTATQQLEAGLDTDSLRYLSLSEDSLVELPELELHLKSMVDRQSKSRNTSFNPSNGTLFRPSRNGWFHLPKILGEYEAAALNSLEDWVETGLGQCMMAQGADAAMREAYSILTRYHHLAASIYAANPEALSAMILTLMEIWVCCDKKAISQCSFLAEYDPGIPQDSCFQNLLLPTRSQMMRLSRIEQHLLRRSGNAKVLSSALISKETTDEKCFAARYFDRDVRYQDLMDDINEQSEQYKASKLAELENLKEKRDQLKKMSEKEPHGEVLVPITNRYGMEISEKLEHDDAGCRKCQMIKEADNIWIERYGWPLPIDTPNASIKAKVVVFELNPPAWFATWRDCTAYLILDVLKSRYSDSKQVAQSFALGDNVQLGWAYKPGQSVDSSSADSDSDTSTWDSMSEAQAVAEEGHADRIIMASKTKPFKFSHYRRVQVEEATTEKDVIVPGGAKYFYYDAVTDGFVGSRAPTDIIAHACMYRMPERSKILERFLLRTSAAPDGEQPNCAIANQFNCPIHMTIKEFLELCSVPYGHLLQWRHIALQLHAPGVDLRKEETALVFLQCIYQIGPAVVQHVDDDYDSLRASHVMTGQSDLQDGLMTGLGDSLDHIKQNWESANAVLILTAIATRLISLSQAKPLQRKCKDFLACCRVAASAWLLALRVKMQEASGTDRMDFLTRCIEVACVCMLTFDVEVTHLEDILEEHEQAVSFFQCSIILSELGGGAAPRPSSTVALLKLRFQRLLYRSRDLLRKKQLALDEATQKSWPAYRAGIAKWTNISDNWMAKQVTLSGGGDMSVHFDLLSGQLRINGERLKRTPKAYEAHPLYITLFGLVGLEVVETRVPGMRFSTKKTYGKGLDVHLNLKDGRDFVVQARNDHDTLEIVPNRVFRGFFPDAFVDGYVQWYSAIDGSVEFRPKHSPWPGDSPDKWTLSKDKDNGLWKLSRDGSTLMPSVTPTARHISRLLSPLIASSRIHLQLNQTGLQLDVDLPSIQLGFNFRQGTTHLLSKEFRFMAVDSSQQLGTLVGFRNKILLKHTSSGNRLALIPEGTISYEAFGDHVSVAVDRASVSKVHPIFVDPRLGRLIDNGSMQCKLFMAYIHALTSFCLPDPLTRKSGTEQALTILNSAAVRSFDQLTESNKASLALIAKLTPSREYYPKDERIMQTVTWDSELSFISQHGWFYRAVKAIFNQAKRSSFFYPESLLRLPKVDHVVEALLDRDCIRSSVFHISEFGADDHTDRYDVPYTTGDRDQHAAELGNAFRLCVTVADELNSLIWAAPSFKQLWGQVEKVAVVAGSHSELDAMKYDSALLAGSEAPILQFLLPLQSAITRCRMGDKAIDKYKLMVWLATIAFSPAANLQIVQIAALLSKVSELHGVSIPDVEYCSPADGRTCKTIAARDALAELVDEATIEYKHSPDYLTKAQPKETAGMAEARRQNDYARNKKKAVSEFVSALRKQWPTKDPITPQKPCPEWITDYVDVEKALTRVRPMFQTWWNNELLYQYLQKIGESMAGLKLAVIEIPDQVEESATPTCQITRRSISVDDLFAGPAPVSVASEMQLPRLEIAQTTTMLNAASAAGESRLGILIEAMKIKSSGFEIDYLERLQGSLLSLRSRQSPAFAGLPDLARVQNHLRWCGEYVAALYHMIQTSMRDNQDALVGHTQPWHSPRVSPMLLIQQLSRHRWHRLSALWKQLIVQYGLALAAHQRAERLLKSSNPPNTKELIKELRNIGHTNADWDPMQHPESLLLEIESGILIREVQAEIATKMISPQDGASSTAQLMMGEGKSSCVTPMVATSLANGSQLVRVIVAKPQSKQMAQMLQSKLGGLLDRRVYFMPFSRAVEPTQAMADAMQSILQECMAQGGVMLMQPEHILSFQLMELECHMTTSDSGEAHAAQKVQVGKHVMRIQDFLDQNARDVVDESDEVFSVRFELVYTMGKRRDIELAPSRWQHIQEILQLTRVFGKEIFDNDPAALEFNDHGGGFPRIRILDHKAGERLVSCIAREICDHGTLDFRVEQAVRDAVFVYLTKFDLTKEEISEVEQSKFWSTNKTTLLLFRGLFATGILAFTLEQKRWRVNYGLTDRVPRTRLAVPYRAKDSPTHRSEYSHPDVVILLTSLSYYYEGLSENDLFLSFTHLMKSDNAASNYSAWISDTNIPVDFRRLSGINLNDRPTCLSLIFPHLRHAKGVVDYFLSNLVFSKELREFPKKLSTSGWDIAKGKCHPTTGFSGTNDSRVTLPLSLRNLDLQSQNHTNALVLDYLLRPENTVALMPDIVDQKLSHAQRLLDMVIAMKPAPQVILDVGAQILELTNKEVARTWLQICSDSCKEAAVFCNEADELMVVDRKGVLEALQTSSYATRLDACLVYLDEAHTRGIDLKLPHDSRAAVTLGAGLTKDTLVQACMRMRELGKGQAIVFCVSAEIDAKIRACSNLLIGEGVLDVEDVIQWTVSQTFDEVRRSMPLWAMQGYRHLVQQRLWRKISSDGKTRLTPESAVHFQENEAKTIESRYRPGDRFTTALDKLSNSGDPEFQALAHRCRQYDHLQANSRRFQEEQERELLAESEEERVVEGAILAEPAVHHLSKELIKLVQEGPSAFKTDNVSSTFKTAFSLLKHTTAALELDPDQLVPNAVLVATQDFSRTIQDLDVDSAADSFQRPVQWILTIRPRASNVATLVVLVSPYEAQALVNHVLTSPYAALHLFKPKCNLGYQSTDKLKCLTICNVSVKVSIPLQLYVQVNVFSGALYFNSFEEYEETCKFLGLASGPARKGWEVHPDGYIAKDDRGRSGGQSGLRKSPIEFLNVLLMKVRKTGGDINNTDMGKLLEGKLLKRGDFKGRG